MDNPIKAFLIRAHSIASEQIPKYSHKYSKKVFTQPQLVALNLLRIHREWTYRGAEHSVDLMDTVQRILNLTRVPDHSTIHNAYERISCWRLRLILKHTTQELESTGILAVDATGFQRRWSSRYYTIRTGMTLKALKVTVLADVGDAPFVQDVHITTTRRHDTKILPKLIPKDASGSVLAGDKGYDDETIRNECRSLGIEPLIKHREFGPHDRDMNQQLDDAGYNQRQKIESLFSSVKRKLGAEVSSRCWYRQFRDVIARMIVHNLDQMAACIAIFWMDWCKSEKVERRVKVRI